MSYNFTITRNNIPSDDKEAWKYLEELQQQETEDQSTDFLELIEKFKRKFPCICDLPDDQIDNGVWSDGPLSNNAGTNLTTLGLVYSAVEVVLPVLIEIAIDNEFVIFDYQTGEIYRSKFIIQTTTNVKTKKDLTQKNAEKKSFWTRLFGQ